MLGGTFNHINNCLRIKFKDLNVFPFSHIFSILLIYLTVLDCDTHYLRWRTDSVKKMKSIDYLKPTVAKRILKARVFFFFSCWLVLLWYNWKPTFSLKNPILETERLFTFFKTLNNIGFSASMANTSISKIYIEIYL